MFSLVPILVNEQKNRLRFVRRQLRDTMNPYVIPEERFYEMYRMPPALAIKLTEEFRPFAGDTDDIPLHLQILSALNFYASGSYQRRVGSDALCCISQSKVSQIIGKLSYIGYEHLSKKFIRFPTSDEEVKRTKDRFQEKYKFPGIIGIADGACVYTASVLKEIEFGYMNRRCGHCINCLIVCDADLVITYLNTRFPGSTHDAIVWMSSQIFAHLEMKYAAGELDDTWLLADAVYPLQPFLMIPVEVPTNYKEKAFNKNFRKIRSIIERCIGHLKGRFRCLMRERQLRYSHTKIGHIVTTCAVIQNFLIKNNFDITDAPMVIEDNDNLLEVLNYQEDNYLTIGNDVRNTLISKVTGNLTSM